MTTEQFSYILERIFFGGAITLAILLGDGIFFCWYWFDIRKKLKNWEKLSKTALVTDGIVRKVFERRVGHGTDVSYVTCAQYAYTAASGKEYIGQFDFRKRKQVKEGDAVKVYYNPEKPSDHYTEHKVAQYKSMAKKLKVVMICLPCVIVASVILAHILG